MDGEWKKHNPYRAQLWNVFDWHGPMQCIFYSSIKQKKKIQVTLRLSNTLRIRSTHQLQSFDVEMRVRVRKIIPAGPIFHSQNKSIPFAIRINVSQQHRQAMTINSAICSISYAWNWLFSCLVPSRLSIAHLFSHLTVSTTTSQFYKECIKFPHTHRCRCPIRSSDCRPQMTGKSHQTIKPQKNPKQNYGCLFAVCHTWSSHKFNY